ncbi:MAG: tetratricopeptide repeat protein, partial [Candidatus Sericytochromatia bacterium]|nr:tetratricopeptide repeat protein [Candidatus Sericytochromatia bacterium]
KLRDDQARSFYYTGLEHIKKQRIDKAIDSFKQAIEIKSDIAEFHSQLGLAYKTKSWTGMAQGEFKLAYKYNRNDKIAKANMSPEDLAPANKKVEEKKGFFGGLFSFGKKK